MPEIRDLWRKCNKVLGLACILLYSRTKNALHDQNLDVSDYGLYRFWSCKITSIAKRFGFYKQFIVSVFCMFMLLDDPLDFNGPRYVSLLYTILSHGFAGLCLQMTPWGAMDPVWRTFFVESPVSLTPSHRCAPTAARNVHIGTSASSTIPREATRHRSLWRTNLPNAPNRNFRRYGTRRKVNISMLHCARLNWLWCLEFLAICYNWILVI